MFEGDQGCLELSLVRARPWATSWAIRRRAISLLFAHWRVPGWLLVELAVELVRVDAGTEQARCFVQLAVELVCCSPISAASERARELPVGIERDQRQAGLLVTVNARRRACSPPVGFTPQRPVDQRGSLYDDQARHLSASRVPPLAARHRQSSPSSWLLVGSSLQSNSRRRACATSPARSSVRVDSARSRRHRQRASSLCACIAGSLAVSRSRAVSSQLLVCQPRSLRVSQQVGVLKSPNLAGARSRRVSQSASYISQCLCNLERRSLAITGMSQRLENAESAAVSAERSVAVGQSLAASAVSECRSLEEARSLIFF